VSTPSASAQSTAISPEACGLLRRAGALAYHASRPLSTPLQSRRRIHIPQGGVGRPDLNVRHGLTVARGARRTQVGGAPRERERDVGAALSRGALRCSAVVLSPGLLSRQNEDLQPVPPEKRTWGKINFVSL
jgi:hypothetical protein